MFSATLLFLVFGCAAVLAADEPRSTTRSPSPSSSHPRPNENAVDFSIEDSMDVAGYFQKVSKDIVSRYANFEDFVRNHAGNHAVLLSKVEEDRQLLLNNLRNKEAEWEAELFRIENELKRISEVNDRLQMVNETTNYEKKRRWAARSAHYIVSMARTALRKHEAYARKELGYRGY